MVPGAQWYLTDRSTGADPLLLVVKDRFGEVQVASRTGILGKPERRLVKSREVPS